MRRAALLIVASGVLGLIAFFLPLVGSVTPFGFMRAGLDLDFLPRVVQCAFLLVAASCAGLLVLGRCAYRRGLDSPERALVALGGYVEIGVTVVVLKTCWSAASIGAIVFFAAGAIAIGGVLVATKHSA